jgi:hypothetical protein
MTDAIAALGLEVEYVPHKVLLTHPETEAPLLDENGEQAFIEVEGYNSPAGEKLMRQAKMRMQVKGKKADQDLDIDKAREENADALAQLVKSWHLVNLQTGIAIPADSFPANFANARQLFARKATAWMAQQVGAALNVQSNFIKA